MPLERGEVLGGVFEVPPARLTHDFERQQGMLKLPNGPFTRSVVALQLVQQGAQLWGALAQPRKQQPAFLGVVQPLGKLVDVEQHGAQQRKRRQGRVAPRLLQQQQQRPQHGRQSGRFVVDDAQGSV